MRALSRYQSAADIENLPQPLPGGGYVSLRKVAEVKETFARQDSYALLKPGGTWGASTGRSPESSPP